MNKRDVVIEGRLSSIDIATCAKFLYDKGIIPSSNSELMSLITQLAVKAVGGTCFLSKQDARDFLNKIGLTNLNRSGRGKVNMIKALQLENISDNTDDTRLTLQDIPSDEELKSIAKSLIDKK